VLPGPIAITSYRVCVGTSGIVLCKSRVAERVQIPGGVFNTGGKQNGGEDGKMGYIYSSSCDFFVQHVLLVNEKKNSPAFILQNHQAPHE
jgi:hypothetical protein